MSWITGLADKAENILNKIDQNAATALQIPVQSISPSSSIYLGTPKKQLSVDSAFQPLEKITTNSMNVAQGDPELGEGSINSETMKRTPSSATPTIEGNSYKEDAVAINVEEPNVGKPVYTTDGLTRNTALQSDVTAYGQELLAFKIALSEMTAERDELRISLAAVNKDKESLKLRQRMQELENFVERLTSEREQTSQELRKLETQKNQHAHTNSELETSLAKLQQEYREMIQRLELQKKELERLEVEHQKYRTKAQQALQMKDNVIKKLNSVKNPDDAEKPINNFQREELDALKEEHSNLLAENNNLHFQLEEMQRDCKSLVEQHSKELQSLRYEKKEVESELREQREQVLVSESDQRILGQELEILREQLRHHMTSSASLLQEKEQEIQQIRRSVRARTNNGDSNEDYETRMRTLTQALVEKQNAIESVTAERNALRIQVEKVQEQVKQLTQSVRAKNTSPHNILLCNSTDDAKAQFPLLMRENPFDNRVARRVKRAYSSLDSAGIRIGAFLRRYPLMRILVLLYVALLHIWVMFVLLSSTPN